MIQPSSIENVPCLSFDNSLSHYVDNLDVDYGQIEEFYNRLPMSDKPKLNDCHIHLSALAFKNNRNNLVLGLHTRDRALIDHDSLAPEANIVVFIGSLLSKDKIDELSSVIGHELVHYAQSNSPPDVLTDEQEALLLEYFLKTNKLLSLGRFAIGSAAYGGANLLFSNYIEHHSNLLVSAGFGVGTQAFSRFFGRKQQRKKLSNLRKEIHEHYKQDVVEQEAETYAEGVGNFVNIKLSEAVNNQAILLQSQRGFVQRRTIDYMHRKLATGTPIEIASKETRLIG